MEPDYDPLRGDFQGYGGYSSDEEFVEGGVFEKEEVFEQDASFKDTQRTSTGGARKTEKEWQNILRDPKKYSLHQLEYAVFQIEPFDDIPENQKDQIFQALKDFPHLEIRNIPLLIAAYLFNKREGKLTDSSKNNFERSYQQYELVFNKVDYIRYIRLIEKNEKQKRKSR